MSRTLSLRTARTFGFSVPWTCTSARMSSSSTSPTFMVLAVAILKVSVKSIIELLTANLPRPFRFFADRSFTFSPASLSVLSWPDADVPWSIQLDQVAGDGLRRSAFSCTDYEHAMRRGLVKYILLGVARTTGSSSSSLIFGAGEVEVAAKHSPCSTDSRVADFAEWFCLTEAEARKPRLLTFYGSVKAILYIAPLNTRLPPRYPLPLPPRQTCQVQQGQAHQAPESTLTLCLHPSRFGFPNDRT